MARPGKTGLDYFPFDVDAETDDKIQLIEAEHGITGFAVMVKLWCRIYKNGYYYNWTEKEQLLFSKNINVDINTVNVVINDAIKWELFNEYLFEHYQILTSKRIQETFLEAIGRRKSVEMRADFVLVNINAHKNGVKVNVIEVNVNENPIKESKVKRKEKESKVNTVYDINTDEINNLINFFGFTEMRNPDKQHQAYTFLKVLTSANRIDYFTEQFNAYKIYKTERKEIKHGFNSFLGTIENNFNDGGWNAKNWVEEVRQMQVVNGNTESMISKTDKAFANV